MATALLTPADLQATLDDERHLGFGYAESRYLSDFKREALDQKVVAVANEFGLDAEELFLWANSKYGRWLCDSTYGARVTRELVRKALSRTIIEELKREAA